MSRHLMILSRALGLLLLGVVPAMAATQPTLYTINSGTPKVLGQGVQKSWPIKVNESNAFDAVFKGGMWLPNPAGGQIYVKYQRHILHDNGTWTWIGTTSTVHGDQSVVLTFGKDGVFGLVPLASGYPLRIMTRKGQTTVVETSAKAMASSAEALRLYSKPDYFIPPRVAPQGKSTAALPHVAENAAAQIAASGTVTIDVMVAYTLGFVTEIGSQSLALTRIQNLVDTTNQAYVASGVNQQIRLVNTVEVNYPDNTANQSALDDITGIDEHGNPVTIPASLQGIAGLRVQYGADLVTLIRSFDYSTQGNCGVGWLIGGNQTPITQQSNIYGYNVVSDGTSTNSSGQPVYCLDTTFAHELGHNMGDAHDRADATDPDGAPLSGAYPYSYGYLGTGTGGGFSTIMAYGTPSDTYLNVFSNPNISTCLNSPCGVADNLPNSADNAHSMNNTAATIASFEPTIVGNTGIGFTASNDINGNGHSALLWLNASASQFAFWQMNGPQVAGSWGTTVSPGYWIAATGDFTGDRMTDLVWTSKSNDLWLWIKSATSFTSQYIGTYPAGYTLVGAANITGGSGEELLFLNSQTNAFAYWILNGSKVVASWGTQVSPGYHIGAIGDFNGDGRADLIWTSSANDLWLWTSTGGGFNGKYIGAYPAGYQLVGACDINGDGFSDLVFSNQGTGEFAYWMMDGAQVIGSWGTTASKAYHIAATGDFNNDGMCDIVWTSAANDLWMWASTGSGFTGNYIGTYPSGWSLIPSQIMAAWDEP